MFNILYGSGAVATATVIWRFIRSEHGQSLIEKIKNSVGGQVKSLKEAVDNLAQVVSAQGDSIIWLRSELDATRLELTAAKEALHNKENYLEEENNSLRNRVAELEAQVKALEFILSKKNVKKTIPIKRRIK